ncbi:Lrp/AsnC family transcriptional regulator [Luteimonas sp. SJ-92]|uniref:Lrp/AsnC family transcriptional regulator n=1 Tax=Luteimonas salinisoli TaxID=2752307 RepID=A0A853JEX1_9GAMM|nr:Lrp/AsnC family transcriptional regulator [Luteimonas salinisoli]NZA27100.1 Lrp/AsnC family transcriptional regulator [Luteimonas salinisoli]
MSGVDDIDRRILEVLSTDARISLKRLAAEVGLSSPGVAERVRRLQERGVIRGFGVDIDPQALGYPLQAIVRIRPLPGRLQAVQQLLVGIPEFCECDKVTGDDCYIARLHVRSMAQLDEILDRIAEQAETSTAIVKTQPVRRRPPHLWGREPG